MSREGVRFKTVRNLKDDFHSLSKGWLGRFVTKTSEINPDWPVLSHFPTTIRQRKELGEINENRVHNMELCSDHIHGIVLAPGKLFSLRKAIGDPITSRGFKAGPTILNGKLSYTSGGGICQVSTTLFNAALTANLEILEKYNHSSDIWGEARFIDLGRDAVFVYARRDLKFRNNLDCPIQLLMWVDKSESKLHVKITSRQQFIQQVAIHSEIVKKLQPEGTPAENQKAITGWIVETQRKVIPPEGDPQITYSVTERYKPLILSRGN